ncbi:MAG: ribose-phosphate pyrophosphokinase, partial [Lachnospiraceae bacterium]|nr:ribose-phosphate pyrophosphokinase [Lachnospiraceae bacterium]
YITKVVTTNLNYRPPELLGRPWYAEADMTKYLASIIDHMNQDISISGIQSPTAKINKLLLQLKG